MKPGRFDPKEPAFIADPYPVYEQLRAADPIFFHEASGLWFCLDYEDVDFFLRDRRFGRAIDHVLSPEQRGVAPPPLEYEPFTRLGRHSMFDMEPPEHTRIKALVHKAFTPGRINGLRESIQRITSDLLDRAAEKGRIDVIEEFAAPLPVAVIAELLGVPEVDRGRLRPWSQDIVAMYELDHTPEEAERAVRASHEFSDYLRFLGHQRHVDPRDDLITALIQAQEAGDKLTEDEYVSVCVLLLNAGHEATVNVIGNGLLALLQNPDQLVLLRDNPRLIPTAIEELMRYDTPLQLFRRWVLEDVEYKGFALKMGDELGLMFGAANRDPQVFPNPESLDLKRDPNPHLAFGAGVHYCLGAPLARLELEIAFATLLARFPNLAISSDPRFKPRYVIRGLEALYVKL